ncbi:hypothetical protein AA13595_2672 [Gluconacetobacter johannae DSM 13595]|uniref:DUF423 domain-containing protein n=1 Tax=Gluconacetobacter johannae TaxID=112140 RepID=A0A7W4P4C2_9PROT|nr:DUF423 domain-containing protein [Gluconacetobacter johannae]MBB2176922.1 DUF423 domain-containing protein [Gluconacetobacter johannae]GBQ89557.1 hypothetical protein AA13595_2672 [Gluconacetobacter johannae DSM 13595]
MTLLPVFPFSPPRSARSFQAAGGLAGLLSAAGGALAAHLPDAAFAAGGRVLAREAVQMGMWHALALLAVGVLLAQRGRRMLLLLSGCGFAAGIVLFCGAVAWTGVTGLHLGPVAPIGGSTLMLAWLLLAVDAMRA